VSIRENYLQINAGRLQEKTERGLDGAKRDALDCWENERKRKQRRTVIRRGKTCSSVHPEAPSEYSRYTETSPK